MNEITANELHGRISENDIVMLDIRESEELELLNLPGVVHVPMMELPDRLEEIRAIAQTGTDIAVICRSGNRSRLAIEWLSEHGIERLYNLKGGVNEYARVVDPTLTPY